jgi:hypothetical protein
VSASKVPYVERSGDDYADDQQYLEENHGPTSMTGEFDCHQDQYSNCEDQTESEPLGR